MTENETKIAVTGAGISGLAVALMLRKKGFGVDVFEKNPYVGGKMAEIRMQGFRFDTGPSLFTLPDSFLELFGGRADQVACHLGIRRLENICRYFYPGGTVINAWADPSRMAAEIEAKTGEPALRILNYLKKAGKLYDRIAPLFLFNPVREWATIRRAGWQAVPSLLKLDAFRTLHRLNQASFSNPQVVQLFDRYATYNGSDPFQAPATLKVISHLEHNLGAYFPIKGMHSLALSLYEEGQQAGVRFFLATPVVQVRPLQNEVEVVTSSGAERYSRVVNATDVEYFFSRLLTAGSQKIRMSAPAPSTSALVFFWGIRGRFSELDMHNILFSGDYSEEFECLFRKKSISTDPTVYLFITCRANQADAPDGHENWFVMINTPEDCGQDWPVLISEARRNIVQKINRMLRTDIERHIVCEQVQSPLTLQESTASMRGSIYGRNSNSVFAAFSRHPNTSARFRNLYFTGGSVHPGGGIPLCIASARIVAEKIELQTFETQRVD